MSYAPCRFKPFDLPDFETLPPGVELQSIRRAPNPFLFDRGTAQFVPAKVRVPIDLPKVQPNPPTNLSFSKIQDPWHQFGLKWQAPCNVWSRHEVAPAPDGNMYGSEELPDKKVDLSLGLKAIAAIAVGSLLVATLVKR